MLNTAKNYASAIAMLRERSQPTLTEQTNLLDAKAFNDMFASFESSLNSIYQKTRIAFELNEYIETFANEKIKGYSNLMDNVERSINNALDVVRQTPSIYIEDTFLQKDTTVVYRDRDGSIMSNCTVEKSGLVPYTSTATGGQYGIVYSNRGEILIDVTEYKKGKGIQLIIEESSRLNGRVASTFIFEPDAPFKANRISFKEMNGEVIAISVFNDYNVETEVADVNSGLFLEQEIHKIKFTVATTEEVV